MSNTKIDPTFDMKKVSWVVYVHASNADDFKSSEKCLLDMQSKLKDDVDAYVIFFGPTLNSSCTLRYYDRESMRILMTRGNKGFSTIKKNICEFVSIINDMKADVRGICFHTHGGTCGLGKWHKWSKPFLSITDCVQCIVNPLPKARFICFDSCDQGSMGCLYELPQHVQVVTASPAFHPYASVLSTKAFGELGRFKGKEELLNYGHRITCQWYTLSKEKWRGMLVFDMEYMTPIANEVSLRIEDLVYDKSSQIDKLDANIHDLYTAARNLPELRKLIRECVRSSCKKCFTKCNSKIHGPSIDPHLPRKWIPAFKSTKWYKEVVKGKKGFESWRKGW